MSLTTDWYVGNEEMKKEQEKLLGKAGVALLDAIQHITLLEIEDQKMLDEFYDDLRSLRDKWANRLLDSGI